jgi:hypothetical protein
MKRTRYKNNTVFEKERDGEERSKLLSHTVIIPQKFKTFQVRNTAFSAADRRRRTLRTSATDSSPEDTSWGERAPRTAPCRVVILERTRCL